MTAPRGARSLLRPLLGAHGAALLEKLGVRTFFEADPPRDATAGFARAGARLSEAAAGSRRARARAGRCNLAGRTVGMAKILAVCGIGAVALWSGVAPAFADDVAPPPTTTTPDAPPPDPYKPPVRSVSPKPAVPHRAAPLRSAPVTPARTFTPSVPSASRPVVRKPRAVKRQRKQSVSHPTKTPPVSTWLPPLSRVVAAARIPLPVTNEQDHPYLWLAGLAFAVLAAAGLSLHMLTARYFDLRFE
jgi:hypothetical protein